MRPLLANLSDEERVGLLVLPLFLICFGILAWIVRSIVA